MRRYIFFLVVMCLSLYQMHFATRMQAQIFSQLPNSSFPNGLPTQINESDVNWGDYDNDGDLDLLAVGYPGFTGDAAYHVQLYQNNGGSFFPTNPRLEPIQLPTASWADYDNDGDLDILLLGMDNSYQPFGQLYNNTGGNFTPISTNIPGCYGSMADWGDYDNDGDLDLLMAGFRFGTRITKLFRNDGNGQFIEVNTPFPGVAFGELKWWDYDKDGDLDVILTGADSDNSNANLYSKVYTNNVNNNGGFTENFTLSISLPDLTGGNLALSDYDGDGTMDVLLAGQLFNGQYITRIFSIASSGFFVENNPNIPGIKDGDVSWADYNNDGLPDIAVTGLTSSFSRTSKLYQNNGNNFFSEVFTGLTETEKGNVRWGDFNNDNKIDLILTGRTSSVEESNSNRFLGFYQNNSFGSNTLPNPPTGLNSSNNGNTVTLNWGSGIDGQTPPASLTYNIRVGTSSGAIDIVSPMAHSNGYRKVIGHGNVQQNRSWTLKDLPDGTYYWSVQSIDANYSGSSFASEQTFTIGQQPTTDLRFSQFTVSDGCLNPGAQINVQTLINNSGSIATPTFNFNIYLSRNTQYDINDTFLATITTSIPTNSTVDLSRFISLPSSIAAGDYYIIGSIDHFQVVTETNESNNQRAIDVATAPVIEAGNNLTLCPNSGTITLTGMSPPGGVWSGIGIIDQNGQFSPSVAGMGQHLLTYTYSNNGCTSSDTRLITIEDRTPPTIVCPANIIQSVVLGNCSVNINYPLPSHSDDCSNSTLTRVQGLPPGEFPIGQTNILYRATDASNNSSQCSFSVNVVSTGRVDAGADITTCINSIPFNISPVTLGGTWAGQGITNSVTGSIDPSLAGIGTHPIVYTVGQGNCPVSDTVLLTVNDTTNIQAIPDLSLCLNRGSYPLELMNPAGGIWSGQGVTNGGTVFNPALVGSGSYTIQYEYTNVGNCNSTFTRSVNVIPPPIVQIAQDTVYPVTNTPQVLPSATPVGGTWFGAGISDANGLFSPTQVGPGTHIVFYTYTNPNSFCSDTASIRVTVDPSLLQTDMIELRSGWNLISTDVIPEDSSITSVFAPLLPNNLIYVTGFDGGAIVYDPSLPPFLNTLTHIKANYGYWVRVAQPTMLEITGAPIDPTIKRTLFAQTNNLIAYIPQEAISPSEYFSSIISNGWLLAVSGFDQGSKFYDPLVPPFLNSLDSMRNGLGYYVQVSNNVNSNNYRKASPKHHVSPDFMFIGGKAPIQITEGSLLEIQKNNGEIIGEVSIAKSGFLTPTPIYGDNPYTPELDGLQNRDTLWLVHKGNRLYPAISFSPDRSIHKADFQTSELGLSVFPNPTNRELHITYNLIAEAPVEIAMYNIYGIKIEQIASSVQSAGSHQVKWQCANLSTGSYLLRFQNGLNKPIWKKILVTP